MTYAPVFLHRLLGEPDFATATTAKLMQDVPGECAVCGSQADETANADRALGANFADRSLLANNGSDRICRACLWCASGKPPATLRMWSIAAAEGRTWERSHEKAWLQDTPHVCLTNRANPHPILDTLLDPPAGDWMVTVAYSGQKHVVPYAPINHGPGEWRARCEDHTVTATSALFRHVWTNAQELRRLGVPEDAVMAGEPRFIKTPDQLASWRGHADALNPYLGSPILRLALWCITKETMK